jgi:hypothetical protein
MRQVLTREDQIRDCYLHVVNLFDEQVLTKRCKLPKRNAWGEIPKTNAFEPLVQKGDRFFWFRVHPEFIAHVLRGLPTNDGEREIWAALDQEYFMRVECSKEDMMIRATVFGGLALIIHANPA